MHTWGNYVIIYTSYELTAIDNVSTGIYPFHIIDICFLKKYARHITYVCPIAHLL